MSTDLTAPGSQELLRAVLNLSHFHREHEKFYASSPREVAVVLQRHARSLQALADRWVTSSASHEPALSPFAGAEDLNAPAALQLDGVLFMEGEGRPAEIAHIVRDLRCTGADLAAAGEWLAAAMQSSWGVAAALVDFDDLAAVLGERHRIIANDWHAASMSSMAARLLERAADMLDRVDFTPTGLRADLDGRRVAPRRVFAAAELIDHAADLCSDSAGLVHDNERRWRVFREQVVRVTTPTSEG